MSLVEMPNGQLQFKDVNGPRKKVWLLYLDIIYVKFIPINVTIFYIIYFSLQTSTITLIKANKWFRFYHIN